MRRFNRELRTTGPDNLKFSVNEAQAVFAQSDRRGSLKRPAFGPTHSIAEINSWHLADAMSVINDDKGKLVLASRGDSLTMVRDYKDTLFWTQAPAQQHTDTPLALSLSAEHGKHIAQQWKLGSLPTGRIRFSHDTPSIEIFDTQGDKAILAFDGKARITPDIAQVDWQSVWATPLLGGEPVKADGLIDALTVLLRVTEHAGKDWARQSKPRKSDRHDHPAIIVDQGLARLALRSAYCQAPFTDLAGLQFSLGRRNAKRLASALRLMLSPRRHEAATEAGRTPGPVLYAKQGDLNIFTNGDVGFAFRDLRANGPAPALPLPADIQPIAVTRQSPGRDGFGLIVLDIISDNLDDRARLVRRGQALTPHIHTARGQGPDPARGQGPEQVELLPIASAPSETRPFAGPIGVLFNATDLINLIEVREGETYELEALANPDGKILGLRYSLTVQDQVKLVALVSALTP